MNELHRMPIVLLAVLAGVSALALSGCNSSSQSPTAPAGPLIINAFQTATQNEASGVRVQVRARVMEGLNSLDQATRTGTARGRVCLDGSCIESPIARVFSERNCAAVSTVQVAGARLGFAAAWLDGDVVGIDFCVEGLTGGAQFALLVSDGLRESNIVSTTCSLGGGVSVCGSD